MMQEAFSGNITLNPNFNALISDLQKSSQVVKMIDSLVAPTKGGTIMQGVSGGGTYNNGLNITVDPSWLPANATPDQVLETAVAISHELGHVIDAVGPQYDILGQSTAAAASNAGLQSEGMALRDEFIASQQMNTSMHSQLNNNQKNIQTTLAGIAQKDGGYSNDPLSQFSKDAVAAGAAWAANASGGAALDLPRFGGRVIFQLPSRLFGLDDAPFVFGLSMRALTPQAPEVLRFRWS
jgi:hypothetical protein